MASWEKLRIPIRIQTGSPAASFIAPMREAGVDVVEVSLRTTPRRSASSSTPASNDRLRHLGGSHLDAAVKGAV